ncbi:hypothetical protein BS78_05G008100 [Paspalum vaginatum]|nr:hypothetical protein BS78_05G008100 [Paspalum vaginatum]
MAEQPGIEHVDLNINGDYPQSIDGLRVKLLAHPDPKPEDLRDRLLRRQKTPRAPPRWMHIKLTSGEKHATLAVRDDNVYLVGFKGQEKWFEFGKESAGSKHIIHKGSIFLGFDGDYGGIQNLDIQSSSITSAVCCLANLETRWEKLSKKKAKQQGDKRPEEVFKDAICDGL